MQRMFGRLLERELNLVYLLRFVERLENANFIERIKTLFHWF